MTCRCGADHNPAEPRSDDCLGPRRAENPPSNLRRPDVAISKWDNWVDNDPTEPGIYATLHCWDLNEGIFPDSCEWDGQRWKDTLPIIRRSSQTFTSLKEAREWAYEHDVEAE